LEEKSEN